MISRAKISQLPMSGKSAVKASRAHKITLAGQNWRSGKLSRPFHFRWQPGDVYDGGINSVASSSLDAGRSPAGVRRHDAQQIDLKYSR